MGEERGAHEYWQFLVLHAVARDHGLLKEKTKSLQAEGVITCAEAGQGILFK